jgi:hypothetical protein
MRHFVNMIDILRMGLKPRIYLYFTNPFTKVNSLPRLIGGNLNIDSQYIEYLLPSALADGFCMLYPNRALATFYYVSVKRQFQLIR